ncbi:hypothetical protein, partial [Lactobacillus nasalidis]|uniref:hypothetical protein n=1 Tax=Lactobacillus nasalidis TaxID=2797258 RepID=UPI0019161601
MPIYKYLLSILTTISAIAGAFLAASSALSAGLQGGMLAAGLFTGLFFLYGLSAVYLWRPDKRLLWLLTAGLVLAAGGLAFAGQLLAAGAAVILL